MVGHEGRRDFRGKGAHRTGRGVGGLDVDPVHHAAVPREHDLRTIRQPGEHPVVVVRGGILLHRHRGPCVQVEDMESGVVEFPAGEHGGDELGLFERLQPFDGRDTGHAPRVDPGHHQTLGTGRPGVPERRLHVPLLEFVPVVRERHDPAVDRGAERQVVVVESNEPLPVRRQAFGVGPRPQTLEHFSHERLRRCALRFADQVRHEGQRGRRTQSLDRVCVEIQHKGLSFNRELHGRGPGKGQLPERHAQPRGLMPQRLGEDRTESRCVEKLVDGTRVGIDPVNDRMLRPALRVPEAVAVGHPVGSDAPAFDQRAEVEVALVGGLPFRGDLRRGRWDQDGEHEKEGQQRPQEQNRAATGGDSHRLLRYRYSARPGGRCDGRDNTPHGTASQSRPCRQSRSRRPARDTTLYGPHGLPYAVGYPGPETRSWRCVTMRGCS